MRSIGILYIGGLAGGVLLCVPALSNAQLPGAPTLQNAFVGPGFSTAVDGAGGAGSSVYALAGAWGASRVQFSLGLGMQNATAANRLAYGLRAAVPLMGASGGALGVAAFLGVGGTSGAKAADSVRNVQLVPVGATVSFRSASAMHGVSAYVSPVYEHYSGGVLGMPGGNLFRVALGADLGLSSAFGLTVGAELGQSAAKGAGGPSGTSFGVGLSYAMKR